MSLGVPAGTLIVAVAAIGAGTVAVGAAMGAFSSGVDSQQQATRRLHVAENEDVAFRNASLLDCHGGPGSTDCDVTSFWDNNGSREIPIDEVTVLVCGIWRDTDDASWISHYEVEESPGSDLWMPGERLHVRVEKQGNNEGNYDITIRAPFGDEAVRRGSCA